MTRELIYDINDEVRIPTKINKAASSDLVVLHSLDCYATLFNVANRNTRIYTRDFWEKVLQSDYVIEKRDTKTLFGDTLHNIDPKKPVADIEILDASHVIPKWKIDDKGVLATFDILNNPKGKALSLLLRYGSKLGISTRALGTEKKNSAGYFEPDINDYMFIGWDFVSFPAFSSVRASLSDSMNLQGRLSDEMLEEVRDFSKAERKALCDCLGYDLTALDNSLYPDRVELDSVRKRIKVIEDSFTTILASEEEECRFRRTAPRVSDINKEVSKSTVEGLVDTVDSSANPSTPIEVSPVEFPTSAEIPSQNLIPADFSEITSENVRDTNTDPRAGVIDVLNSEDSIDFDELSTVLARDIAPKLEDLTPVSLRTLIKKLLKKYLGSTKEGSIDSDNLLVSTKHIKSNGEISNDNNQNLNLETNKIFDLIGDNLNCTPRVYSTPDLSDKLKSLEIALKRNESLEESYRELSDKYEVLLNSRKRESISDNLISVGRKNVSDSCKSSAGNIKNLVDSISEYEHRMQAQELDNEVNLKILTANKRHLSQLTDSVKEKNTIIGGLETKLRDLESKLGLVKKLKRENTELTDSLILAKGKFKKLSLLNSRLTEKTNKLESVNDGYSRLKSSYDELKNNYAGLKEELKTVNNKLNDSLNSDRDLRRLTSKNKSLSESLEMVNRELTSVKRELKNVKDSNLKSINDSNKLRVNKNSKAVPVGLMIDSVVPIKKEITNSRKSEGMESLSALLDKKRKRN